MRLSCVFLTSLGTFPGLLEFRASSSASASFLICLCFSPVLVISPPPPFVSDALGFDSVLGVATSHAVPAVAPPFFRSFVSAPSFLHAAVPAAPCSLSLHFSAYCGYGWFFRSSSEFSACCDYGCHFLSSSAFPPAAAPAATSSLHSRFPHAATLAASFSFDAAPAVFLAEGSPVAVPWGPVAAFPNVYARFLSTSFRRMLSFLIGLFPQAAFSSLVSPHPRSCLRCFSIRLRFLLSLYALLCFV